MRTTLLVLVSHLLFFQLNAQTLLKMEQLNGIQVMPCKVNNLTLKFIIDTGEKDARISITDAMFMLKNGYITTSDIVGTEYERFVNGHVSNGTIVKIKQLEIGNTTINNIVATIVTDLSSPLVLGQSVLYKIGKIEFDYSNQLVTIRNKNDYMIDNATASISGNVGTPVKTVNTGTITTTTEPGAESTAPRQKLLVKVRTNLYSRPENGHAIAQVNSNSFVNLIGEFSDEKNFLYVDYMGYKGYINRLALEIRKAD
ncbi:MAG: retroviral-like aspartic protease family protein [Bacteroidota bacterium]|nr:retroviral-like aspartic protease family protein [Bacteroidota bacterium]